MPKISKYDQQCIDYSKRCQRVAEAYGMEVYGITLNSSFGAHHKGGAGNPIQIPHWLMEIMETKIRFNDKEQSSQTGV